MYTLASDSVGAIAPLKQIEYGFGYVIIRCPYTPYSIYLRRTIYELTRGIAGGGGGVCKLS